MADKVKSPDFLSMKVSNAIRARWNDGKKHITLDGRKYTIAKFTRTVSFMSGGQVKRQVEQWLRVRPADGSLVPCATIELKDQGNLRTARAKS